MSLQLPQADLPTSPSKPSQPQGVSRPLSYVAQASDYALLIYKNALLTVLTIGIYRFWGKTNKRKFIWSHLVLEGSRFQYTGTAKHLYMGFAKFVVPAFILWVLIGNVIELLVGNLALPIVAALVLFHWGLLFWAGFALRYLSLRYWISNTKFRGVHFRFGGNFSKYIKEALIGSLFTLFTLGLYYPFLAATNRKNLTEAISFGPQKLSYSGKGWDLWYHYIIAFPLLLLTLGLYYPWHQAWLTKFHLHHTRYGKARLGSKISGEDLFMPTIVGGALILFTLGLAYPFVSNWYRKTLFNSFRLRGPVDFEEIVNEAKQDSSAGGEALASFFDFDAGI